MTPLSVLNPAWCSPFPVGDGIGMGLAFNCPVHPKRRHQIYFAPMVNPYAGTALDSSMVVLQRRFHEYVGRTGAQVWHRTSGEDFASLTLSPSIKSRYRTFPIVAGKDEFEDCCHINVGNGHWWP